MTAEAVDAADMKEDRGTGHAVTVFILDRHPDRFGERLAHLANLAVGRPVDDQLVGDIGRSTGLENQQGILDHAGAHLEDVIGRARGCAEGPGDLGDTRIGGGRHGDIRRSIHLAGALSDREGDHVAALGHAVGVCDPHLDVAGDGVAHDSVESVGGHPLDHTESITGPRCGVESSRAVGQRRSVVAQSINAHLDSAQKQRHLPAHAGIAVLAGRGGLDRALAVGIDESAAGADDLEGDGVAGDGIAVDIGHSRLERLAQLPAVIADLVVGCGQLDQLGGRTGQAIGPEAQGRSLERHRGLIDAIGAHLDHVGAVARGLARGQNRRGHAADIGLDDLFDQAVEIAAALDHLEADRMAGDDRIIGSKNLDDEGLAEPGCGRRVLVVAGDIFNARSDGLGGRCGEGDILRIQAGGRGAHGIDLADRAAHGELDGGAS